MARVSRTSKTINYRSVANRKFKEDYRESNPKLHHLYFGWALVHLTKVRKMLAKLNDDSNLHMFHFACALSKEYEKLCKENAAYAEADEVLGKMDEVRNERNENNEGE